MTQERYLDKIARLAGLDTNIDYYSPNSDLFKQLMACGLIDETDYYEPMPDVFFKILSQLEHS